MKTNSDARANKDDAKYRALIDHYIVEFKELRKQIIRDRSEAARVRAGTQRKTKETREILRRVEATL